MFTFGAARIAAKLSFPFILGRDLAGTVLEAGAGVKSFKPGDRVWATSQGTDGRPGTFAELAAVHERWLNPTPPGLGDEEMAALSLVSVTAHIGLVHYANLKAGEVLFVNGGTGGVGSSVVQMAKILGARVITTGGTDEKVSACRQLGADLALNYNTQNVDAAIKGFAPEGVNVWWETLREPNFERTIPLLALRGPHDRDGGTRGAADFPGRAVLREGLLGARLCDVQRRARVNSAPPPTPSIAG